MRIWAKLIKDNRILKDMVVEDHGDDTRTHKVFNAIDKISHDFDLQIYLSEVFYHIFTIKSIV